MEMHIGLGTAARVDKLDIWWPATNVRQTFTGLAINQFIEVGELAKDYTKLARTATTLGGGSR